MYNSKNNNIRSLLKGMVGNKATLHIHGESRSKDNNNMSPLAKPDVSDEYFNILFHGVYGIGEKPLYLHGTDLSNREERLYRNSVRMHAEESSGNPTFESSIELVALDGIIIRDWFSGAFFLNDESLRDKLKSKEPDDPYLADKILKGCLHYAPHTALSTYSFFSEPKFIEKVTNYMEKIV